jgi:tetratricopeptide (TPR) repeat protein
MENNNTNFDRIEAYLLGQMSAADATAFEQALQLDEKLAQEVAMQRLEHRTMELLHREALRANMQQWKAEAAEEDTAESARPGLKVVPMKSSGRLFFRLAAAASITLVLGFFARQFFMAGPGNEAMAMAEFGFTESTFRGNDTDLLAPAYEALAKKEYRTALTLLEQIQKDYQAATVLNLRGECHFYLREYAQAASLYQQLLQSNPTDGDLREKAEWRLALSYLAQGGQEAEVKRLLDKVIEGKGQFEGKAREVKGKMR